MITVVAIIAIVAGILVRVFLDWKRFKRRSAYGTEGFDNYIHYKTTRIGERFLRVLANLLITLGILLGILVYADHKMTEHYRSKDAHTSPGDTTKLK